MENTWELSMKLNKRGRKSTHQFVLPTRRNPTEEYAMCGNLELTPNHIRCHNVDSVLTSLPKEAICDGHMWLVRGKWCSSALLVWLIQKTTFIMCFPLAFQTLFLEYFISGIAVLGFHYIFL